MSYDIKVVGARAVGAGFESASIHTKEGTKLLVRQYGQLLLTRIRANASGRPGPNAPTGDYRRSWGMRSFEGTLGSSAEIGTNAVQGRRLEYGFVGTDSLGRHYDQPPFPHVGPAIDVIEPLFVRAIEGLVKQI